MNPLLFADWRRLNRLFTRAMWCIAAVIACVIVVALVSAGPATHGATTPAGPHAMTAGAAITR